MRLSTHPAALPAVFVALWLAGCGIPNPAAMTTPRTTTAPVPTAVRPPATVPAAPRDALVRVAIAFTLTQATWSPDTYVSGRARLAQISTGTARAQLVAPGGGSSADVATILKAGGSSSRASLIATDGPTRQHQVVVAYKVLATGVGRRPGRPDYQLAHLTLTRQQSRWLVSSFAIEP